MYFFNQLTPILKIAAENNENNENRKANKTSYTQLKMVILLKNVNTPIRHIKPEYKQNRGGIT